SVGCGDRKENSDCERTQTSGRRAIACVRAGAALLALACATPLGAAENYPANRPIRLVSPFAAGGSTDTVGRLIAPRLAERPGQNVIVEKRPRARGMIGTSVRS